MNAERREYRYRNDIGWHIEEQFGRAAKRLRVGPDDKLIPIPRSARKVDELTLQGLTSIFSTLNIKLKEEAWAGDTRGFGMAERGDRAVVIDSRLDTRGKNYIMLRFLGHIAVGELSDSREVAMTTVIVPTRSPRRGESFVSVAEAQKADRWVEDMTRQLPYGGTLAKGMERAIDWYKRQSQRS